MDALGEKRLWITHGHVDAAPSLGVSVGNVQKGAVVKGVSDLRVILAMDSHHSMDIFHSPLSMLSTSGTWEIQT